MCCTRCQPTSRKVDHLLINIFLTLLSVGEASTTNVNIGAQAILIGDGAGADSPNIALNEVLIGANCPATNVNGRLSFYSMEAVATTATAGVFYFISWISTLIYDMHLLTTTFLYIFLKIHIVGVRTLPANPSAFMPLSWNGTLYKVPLYNN